jgi:hypothetical protein
VARTVASLQHCHWLVGGVSLDEVNDALFMILRPSSHYEIRSDRHGYLYFHLVSLVICYLIFTL